LVFDLQQQILIELIGKGKVEEALEFAQGRIGTKGGIKSCLSRGGGMYSCFVGL